MDGSGKTVCGLVTGLDDILLGLEFRDGADGAENFLLHDLHIIRDTREYGWLDEVAFLAMSGTAGLNLGAGFLARLDIIHNPIKLELADLWTLEGILGKWVTNNVL